MKLVGEVGEHDWTPCPGGLKGGTQRTQFILQNL